MTTLAETILRERKDKPSPEYMKEAVSYCPDTGALTWRCRADMPKRWNTIYAGTPAFAAKDARGYLKGAITVGRRRFHFLAHQVAWVVATGEWAFEVIDHINGEKADNRLNNLRAVTQAQNVQNSRISTRNTSGLKGVSWSKNAQKWQSFITSNGVCIFIGNFATKDEAHDAYKSYARELHGEYARLQ